MTLSSGNKMQDYMQALWLKNSAWVVYEEHHKYPTSIFTANEGNSAKVFYQDGSSYVLRNIQDITVQPLKGGDTDVCITYKEADKAISEGHHLEAWRSGGSDPSVIHQQNCD